MPAAAHLRITATSFLLPGDAAWDELATTHTLDFGTFGDWPAALLSSSGTALLWVVVLEDLVTPEAHTAVAWLAWRPDSPIRSARTQRSWKRLGDALATSLLQMAALHPSLAFAGFGRVVRPARNGCLSGCA